jgi:hypothetical protein
MLPPVLQQIANEQQEFQINLGRAMDILRGDMQDLLTTKPGTSGPRWMLLKYRSNVSTSDCSLRRRHAYQILAFITKISE